MKKHRQTHYTNRQFSVEQPVLVDGGVALCDPGEPVAGAALAVHAAVEHRRVGVAWDIEGREELRYLLFVHRILLYIVHIVILQYILYFYSIIL